MQKKPYLTDAILGNSSMLVSLTKDGQAQRIVWPNIDFPQHLNRFYVGIRGLPGSNRTYFFHDDMWTHKQRYLPKTNILETEAFMESLDLHASQTDFVLPDKNILVRHISIKNESSKPLSLAVTLYSDFMIDEKKRYQTVFFDETSDCMVHYHREYAFAVGSDQEVKKLQCGASVDDVVYGKLNGSRIINRSSSGIEYEQMDLEPGDEKCLTLFITAAHGHENAIALLNEAKRDSYESHFLKTDNYWKHYLNEADPIEINDPSINNIYERSLLVFHLMHNRDGGFIAGPEVDEDYDFSGGYAYCWGRDAAFISSAVDQAGYHDRARKFFYWLKSIQSQSGAWEQRYYLDIILAPTWGLQIDETGSILWGIHQHYEITQDYQFLMDMWPTVRKGADFLVSFIDPDTKLPLPSKDLWEKRDGEHFYSASAVYGGLMGAAEFAIKNGEEELAEHYKSAAEEMKKTILEEGYNEDNGAFYRAFFLTIDQAEFARHQAAGKEVRASEDSKGYPVYQLEKDDMVDISLLGLNVPFGMIDANEPNMIRTAETIEALCTSQLIGGIERYPGDIYIGGNPWILTTLWLALYYTHIDRLEKAKELLDWCVKYSTELDLLPEQVNKVTGKPAWVLPLTWSHAMFVLTVIEMKKKGIEL